MSSCGRQMTNLIQFPRRSTPPLTSMADELAALELELVRARLAQVRSETRYANALLFSYYVRKVTFWLFTLWMLSFLFR